MKHTNVPGAGSTRQLIAVKTIITFIVHVDILGPQRRYSIIVVIKCKEDIQSSCRETQKHQAERVIYSEGHTQECVEDPTQALRVG